MKNNTLHKKIIQIISEYHIDSFDKFLVCLRSDVTLVAELVEAGIHNGWIHFNEGLADGWYCIRILTMNDSYHLYYQERGRIEGDKELIVGADIAMALTLKYAGYLTLE